MRNSHIFLMYCGKSAKGDVYRQWDPSETEPLLIFNREGQIDSFFQSFLLLAIRSGNGGSLVPGFDAPGDKKDWLAWIEDIFLRDHNLMALIQKSAAYKVEPLDIWLALPYPDPKQKKFGLIWNQQPDLSKNKDRLFLLKWWIHLCLNRWQQEIIHKGLHPYARLQGFYWPRESMIPSDRMMLPELIAYIHSLNLKTLWIPYYAATPLLWLNDPGFDTVIIQPSYLQHPELGRQRLTDAAQRAKKHGAGIEIEFDTSVLYENSIQYKVALDYLNYGLSEYEGYAAGNHAVGYYTGYKTVLALYNKKSPFYDQLYHFVKGTFSKIEYPDIEY